jgi:hypothetical protein
LAGYQTNTKFMICTQSRRSQLGVEPAVSAQLAGVFGQVTGRDDFRDSRSLRGFEANRKPASGLQVVPIAGGTPS